MQIHLLCCSIQNFQWRTSERAHFANPNVKFTILYPDKISYTFSKKKFSYSRMDTNQAVK